MKCSNCGKDCSRCPSCGHEVEAEKKGYAPESDLMKKLTQPAIRGTLEDPEDR